MATKDKNGEYVYPLIPKKYVKPVLFACQIIRKEHTFNKAIAIASKYYGVDPETLKKHVVNRTNAGRSYANDTRR